MDAREINERISVLCSHSARGRLQLTEPLLAYSAEDFGHNRPVINLPPGTLVRFYFFRPFTDGSFGGRVYFLAGITPDGRPSESELLLECPADEWAELIDALDEYARLSDVIAGRPVR